MAKNILLNAKKILTSEKHCDPLIVAEGSISFENQYKILREHLRLLGIGFGVPHDFEELGETILYKWCKTLVEIPTWPLSADETKEKFRDCYRVEPTTRNIKIRLNPLTLIDRFTFIDLFAGIGGFHQAMHSIGGNCVFASEWDKNARISYEANYRQLAPNLFENNNKYFNCDINDVDPKDIPDFQVCCGGFPCQAFSIAGLKRGFDDTRGTLFFNLANIVRYKKKHGHAPKVLFLENVKGLKIHDNGNTLKVILATLEELGYGYTYDVLNAKYFGVPQNRERLFIIAWDKAQVKDGSFKFPYGIDNDGNTIFDKSKVAELAIKTRLGDIFEPSKTIDSHYTISDKMWIGHQERKKRNKLNGKGFGYSLFNKNSQYCSTISARYWKDGSEILIDQSDLGYNPRKLTPVEAGRLQGYNIDGNGWETNNPKLTTHDQIPFQIVVSKKEAYHQFGNSVAVPVIKRLAQEIKKQLL